MRLDDLPRGEPIAAAARNRDQKREPRRNETLVSRSKRNPNPPKTVRVIDDMGNQLGVLDTGAAWRIAQEKGLDLVEVQPARSADEVSIVKIMDWGRHLYEQRKRQKEAGTRQVSNEPKEVQFRPAVGDHDFQVKLRKVLEFLQEGNKVRVVIKFRGREMAHQERGQALVQRVVEAASALAKAEKPPVAEGRSITAILAPARNGQKQAAKAEAPAPELELAAV